MWRAITLVGAVALVASCATSPRSGLEYLHTRTEYVCPGMVSWHCSALGLDR